MKKSILIAGGTGFIGHHLSKKCIKMGWRVTSISSKKPRKTRKIKKVIYVTCSLINKKNIYKKIRNNYDYVVNLSGHVNHKNKEITFNSHYKSVKNLVEFFIRQNKPIKKFIQMGSSAEYGGLTKPQKETAKCVVKSFYGRAKLASTRYLIKQHKLKRFPVTIFRLYQAYGPNQDNNRLIPIVINACKNNQDFKCSDGNQFRDFVYIDDIINAIIKSIKIRNQEGQIFNLGSGRAYQVKKVISTISNFFKGGKPLYGKIKLRKDESKIIYANIDKIKKNLKWKPKVKFKNGLRKTMNFYKENNEI